MTNSCFFTRPQPAALALLLTVFFSDHASAMTYNIANEDVGALITALEEAEASDVIILAENATFTLTEVHHSNQGPNGLPPITEAIEIQGNGATIQRAPEAPEFRILYLDGVGADTVFSDLTIAGGRVADEFMGGGIFAINSDIQLIACTFNGNYAIYGGGFYNDGGSPTITDCVFTNNSADEQGGGLMNVNNANPTISGSLFETNRSFFLGGAGMFNDNSHPRIENCTFKDNLGHEGGGIQNTNSSHPQITDCLFLNNEADERGGAIYNVRSHPTITGCTFTDNFASLDHGGGITNSTSSPTIIDCVFVENEGIVGGGIANLGSSPSVIQCTFLGNTSDFGGGMYNFRSNPKVIDSVFENNEGFVHGGGMVNADNSHPLISGSTFASNTSTENGGAIYNSGNFLGTDDPGSFPTIYQSTFRNNMAGNSGGAIFSETDSISKVGSTFFCGSDPDAISGPWHDLGANEFSDLCGPTYEEWVQDHFDESDWDDDEVTGAFASPTGDGVENVLKYALGLDPTEPQADGLPAPILTTFPESGADEFLSLSFSHPSGLTDVNLDVRLSENLLDWDEPAILVSRETHGATTDRTYRDQVPITMADHRFMRIQVSLR